jgi:hypothetical protein
MIDSGARVFILISPAIAKTMKLTVVPGTSPIRGIGGHGGSEGRTREFIFLRLGGCEAGEVNDDPCTGCFTLKVKPIVMTEMAVQSIGHHVLLGQGFLRYCLGMADPLTERFHYSPAWWSDACRDFRVSVPCTMSTEGVAQVRDFLGMLDAPGSDDIYVDVSYKSRKDRGTTLVAPMAPGFPQTPGVTSDQYKAYQRDRTERNEETRKISREALATAQSQAADGLAHIIEPLGVVFPLNKLKVSGRLLDGMRLDLSGASQAIASQLTRIRDSLFRDLLKELRPLENPTSQAPAPTPHPHPHLSR